MSQSFTAFLCWPDWIWTNNLLRIRQLLLPLSYKSFFVSQVRFELTLHSFWNYCLCRWATSYCCAAFRFELNTFILCLPLRKKGRWLCCRYTKPLWLTPGLEPCSPHSQCGTLPDKLKPTFVIEIGFEPISTVSETGMLPLHHSTISGSYESRTHGLW